MACLRTLLLVYAATSGVASSTTLNSLSSEEAVIEAVASPSFDQATVESADVEMLVHKGWHEAVRALIALSQKASEADAQRVAAQVRHAVQAERNRLDDLTRALDRNYGKAAQVNPAMQWAQNSTHVFISVKFAQRWNAPGALEVQNETVSFTSCCFNFTAFGEHSFIVRRYRLSFELFRPLLPAASSWFFAAAGRMTITLAKATPANWPRLMLDAAAKPQNLGIWRDMKEKWKNELERLPPLIDSQQSADKKEKKAASEKKEKKGKAKKSKKSSDEDEDENEDALDKEVDAISDCPKSSFTGSAVAELCAAAWEDVVDNSRIKNRRWLIEFYNSQGDGDSEAMKALMPVWKRLADVFPSMVPGGRVGALDCATEKELCKKLGASSKLPQIRRGASEIWKGELTASLEEFAAFGGAKDEL